MRKDMTNEQKLAAAAFCIDENQPVADCLAMALGLYFRQPDGRRDPMMSWHLIEALKCFLRDEGGEIHLVTGGESSGEVIAVRHDG